MGLRAPSFLLSRTTDTRHSNGAKLLLYPKKLEEKGSSTSALDKVHCPSLGQHTPPAGPITRSNASSSPFGPAAENLNFLQPFVPLSQPHYQSPTISSKQTTALSLEPLESAPPPMPTDIALTSRPTYDLCILYGISSTFLYTSVCLLNTEASINLIRSEMILQNWASRVNRTCLPFLCTATKQPLALHGVILLHLCFGDLKTPVWFGVAQHQTVDMLLRTSFIDRFIRGIFLSE